MIRCQPACSSASESVGDRERERGRGENVNVCGGIDFNGYSDTFAADVGQSNFSNNL